jgi:hypothetical protein
MTGVAAQLQQQLRVTRILLGTAAAVYLAWWLALVKEIGASLGARVELSSTLGVGSRFTVVFPSEAPPGAP